MKGKLKMKEFKNLCIVYTHSRSFHADDVFSIALLRTLGYSFSVRRVTDDEFFTPSVMDDISEGRAIAVDIGKRDCPEEGFFDHHGKVSVRRDGTKYASFGLLVKHLELCNEPGFESFDHKFVKSLDMTDNGEGHEQNQLAAVIASFNPNWDEDQSKKAWDASFEEAVRFAEVILKNDFKRRKSRIDGEDIIKPLLNEAVKKRLSYIVLNHYTPWQKTLVGTSVLSVVFPMEDGWGIRLVPVGGGSRYTVGRFDSSVRVGNLGVLFVHNTGYLARVGTKEEAINIAKNHVK